MEKLYYDTPYLKIFEAEVENCDENKNGHFDVILNRTAFYPEGGGQPSDTGTINDVNVIWVHEKNGVVIHETEEYIAKGTRVTGKINWEKRFSNMQQHSGEHILSGLIHKHFGYDNVGFHMGSEEVTVDFNGTLTPKQVTEIEEEANELVYRNFPVSAVFHSQEEIKNLEYRSKKELTGMIRIVTIPEGDICACCGTHVGQTGEIGIIKVTGMVKYKSGVRISMLCGNRALEDYRKKQDIISTLSNMLSAKTDTIIGMAEKQREENAAKDMKIAQLCKKFITLKTQGMADSSAPLIMFEEEMLPLHLRQYCTMLFENGKGSIVLVCSGENEEYQYVLGSSESDMKEMSKKLNAVLNGRGGGNRQMAQGTFYASKEKIEEEFEKICR